MSGKKTPLYETHKALGARIVDFGGWDMPIQYSSVIDEHKAVRDSCGLFDVSHMGEIFVEGTDAGEFLQSITINDISKLSNGKGQYTAMLNENGGMIDDLILYRLEDNRYLICANASNVEKDFSWIKTKSAEFKGSQSDLKISNDSENYSQIAVQGPRSQEVLLSLFTEHRSAIEALGYTGITSISFCNSPIFLARTGYTGEWGYELYFSNDLAESLWSSLLEIGDFVKPIGLGARDTLRLEACYLLYGNDMNETVSPLEAGIGWATKLDKGPFIGREALIRQKESGVKKTIQAFVMEDKAIARSGMEIFKGDKRIGHVTSGSVLPTLGQNGGMVFIDAGEVGVGDQVHVDIRGKRKLAKIVKRPLYSAKVRSN